MVALPVIDSFVRTNRNTLGTGCHSESQAIKRPAHIQCSSIDAQDDKRGLPRAYVWLEGPYKGISIM
jgi:hypothetical protein